MKNLLAVVLAVVILSNAQAQQRKPPKLPKFNKNKEKETFLKKQWFLGFKAGSNLSGTVATKQYSVINPTNYEFTSVSKKYRSYRDPGAQATIEATFYFTGFCLTFQPTYRHNNFGYSNHYEWLDTETPENRLELRYVQQQNVDYFDFPVLIRYEKMFNKVSPYVSAGVFYSRLLNASKSVDISGVDYASGGKNEFKNETIIIGATDLFAKNNWGIVGGIGVFYNLGNVRLNLDIQYKKGMNNIAATANRFGSDRLSGVGDVLDDTKLSSFAASVGCLFPLRFIGRNFRSTDNKK